MFFFFLLVCFFIFFFFFFQAEDGIRDLYVTGVQTCALPIWRLGRPASTVRGWLRALAARAEQVRSVFTALAASLVTDPPLPAPAGSLAADAVAAVAAAAAAAARVPGVGTVARWQLAAAVTCGLLLA